ncbi:glycosyl transferase [Cellulomonas sp. Root930]|nr:glycosyl transferase [Cellulomonas sp. Root930]
MVDGALHAGASGDVRVSVCMATYNGEAWVGEQVGSVLAQLGERDELVVVDDASTDGTVDVLRSFDDPRIRLTVAERNRGYVATFADALARSRGTYLLLADQDDVWTPGRVDVMTAALADHDVVAGNLRIMDGTDLTGPFGQQPWRLDPADSHRHARNALGILAGTRPYFGCAMGLRRAVLERATPFPPYLTESHDLWFALYGNVTGSVQHLSDVLVRRRLHEGNASTPRPRGPGQVVRSRLLLLRCLVEIVRRTRR